jgi:hypothetical protein
VSEVVKGSCGGVRCASEMEVRLSFGKPILAASVVMARLIDTNWQNDRTDTGKCTRSQIESGTVWKGICLDV